MPRFSYRAVNSAGETVQGEMEAGDRDSLVRALRDQGYMPVHTEKRTGPARAAAKPAARRGRQGRVTQQGLALFTRELATLLGAGLPVDRALTTLAGQDEAGAMAGVAQHLLEAVRGGAGLADAMARQPGAFPAFYVGLVRAGEAGGTLTEVLTNLADTEERAESLRQDIRSALTYPVLVLIAAGAAIVILLVAVVPEFEPLFANAGNALPWSARAVLAVSDAFRAYWWALPAGVLAVAALAVQARRSPRLRAVRDTWAMRLPGTAPLIRKIEAARFARALGTLLRNGVDAATAIDMAVDTVGNTRLARALGSVASRLRRGEGLAQPLAAANAFPPLATQLMEAGEQSGHLDRMLLTVAGIYDQEVRRDTQRLLQLLVPMVTLLLGVVVAAIMGAILSAILSSYQIPGA